MYVNFRPAYGIGNGKIVVCRSRSDADAPYIAPASFDDLSIMQVCVQTLYEFEKKS